MGKMKMLSNIKIATTLLFNLVLLTPTSYSFIHQISNHQSKYNHLTITLEKKAALWIKTSGTETRKAKNNQRLHVFGGFFEDNDDDDENKIPQKYRKEIYEA